MLKRNIVKSDIIKYLKLRGYNESEQIIEYLIYIMHNALSQGYPIQIKNFGLFNIREKKQRLGMNFHNSKKIIIEDRKSVSFRASKTLKNKIKSLLLIS